jgi:ubiquinone/menaquinone biosynthesis C-methylase UbiE
MFIKQMGRRGQKIAFNRATELAQPVLEWFSGNGRLLDFGCGVGHLGYVISEQSGQKLTSLDVERFPFTCPEAEVEIYDGIAIPYPDNHFDTTIVAYTLHHTNDPVGLLKEIARVTNRQIVVCEDYLISRKHIPIEVIKDVISNYFVAHITMQYRTEDEWEEIFDDLKFTINNKRRFSSGNLMHFEHIAWQLFL